LNADHIAANALAMLDADGIESFTMRKLGTHLGVDPMAVYYYFPSKAALFDGALDALYEQILLPVPLPEDGAEALSALARAVYDAAKAHPRVLPIMATRPIGSLKVFRQLEAVAQRLVASGAGAGDALMMVNIAVFFTIGTLLAEVGEPVGGPERDVMGAMGGVDPAEFPTMMAALAVRDDFAALDIFDMGLDALVAGLRQRFGLEDRT
jgi:AcrR family transcriptional regulator